jgi:hypothetical protein
LKRPEKSDNKLEGDKFVMDVDRLVDEESSIIDNQNIKFININLYDELHIKNSEFDVRKNIEVLKKFEKVLTINPNFSVGGLKINELLLLKPSVWLRGTEKK